MVHSKGLQEDIFYKKQNKVLTDLLVRMGFSKHTEVLQFHYFMKWNFLHVHIITIITVNMHSKNQQKNVNNLLPRDRILTERRMLHQMLFLQ